MKTTKVTILALDGEGTQYASRKGSDFEWQSFVSAEHETTTGGKLFGNSLGIGVKYGDGFGLGNGLGFGSGDGFAFGFGNRRGDGKGDNFGMTKKPLLDVDEFGVKKVMPEIDVAAINRFASKAMQVANESPSISEVRSHPLGNSYVSSWISSHGGNPSHWSSTNSDGGVFYSSKVLSLCYPYWSSTGYPDEYTPPPCPPSAYMPGTTEYYEATYGHSSTP